MKRYHKELTTDSGSATTSISHHVNLNFEIGTSNLCATDRLIDHHNSEQQNDRVNRPRSENRNGVSRDTFHGGDHDTGSDYTSDNCEILGHPNGLRPVSNGIATVQGDSSSGGFSGVETKRQNDQFIGELESSGHETRLSDTVDPISRLKIHPYVRRNIDFDHIDTEEQEHMLLHVSYPRSESEYITANPFEEKFISVLRTGLIPKLRKAEMRKSMHALSFTNSYRRKEGIPLIPAGLFDLKSAILIPIYMDNVGSPSIEPIYDYYKSLELYKENVCIMMTEYEVIGWIIDNKIPKMGDEERVKLDHDICMINNYRHEVGEVELDLGKTLDEHLDTIPVLDYIPIRRSQKRGGVTSRYTADRSMLSEDEDSAQSSNSSSNYSSSEDGYDSRGNPRREEATSNLHEDTSEVDEDDELFAEYDGYDSSGDPRVDNPRVDVDLTSDAVMEDVTNGKEPTSYTENDFTSNNTTQGNRNDEVLLLQMEKGLKSFLNGLLDMTRCPISRQQMVNPSMGEDSYSYEYEYITKWLDSHKSSPMTKCYLNQNNMHHDYTMEKLIRSLKEFKISQPMIDNIGTAPPPTVVTTTTVTTTNVETMPYPAVSTVAPPSASPVDPPAVSAISPPVDPSNTSVHAASLSSNDAPPGTSSTDVALVPATTSEATTQVCQRKKKQKKQRNNRKVRKFATNILMKHIED